MNIINVNRLLLLSVLTIGILSCNDKKQEMKKEITESVKIPGIVLDNMDTSVDPKQDFYNYVNGNWVKNSKIPDDETRWSGFTILRKNTRNDMLNIMEKAQSSGVYKEGTDQKKAVLIYESKLDTIARNKAGIAPIQPLLDAINDIKTIRDMQTVMVKNIGVSDPFFGLGAGPNLNNSTMNIAWIGPGDLGLPDRDYYTNTDEKSIERRQQYKDHIIRMFQYIGVDHKKSEKNANMILKLETELAVPRLTKVESRDARNYNNPRTVDQLNKMTPVIDWQKYIDDLPVKKNIDTVLVAQPKYMQALQNILKKTPINDIKTMIKWSTLNNAAGYLSTEIEKANWDFYSKTLYGAKMQRPANERALGTANGAVGEALGKLYVDAKFPPEAKEKAEKMIANVIKAFQNRIKVLDWMSEETKIKAIKKLDMITVKIAYPDKWKDYSTMEVKEGNSFAENMLAVSEWKLLDNLSEIDKPVDKTKWGMSPQTVNAYYNPIRNEIVFPAAILQPPFYNYTADEAVNYGGIGAVIGHEISHAFDDSGARFDGEGNLNNWWTDEDLKKFGERANALAEQYSAIEVLEDVFINGKFTLGENIGDLGGVLGAYDGLQLFYAANGRPENMDGFTPEQRFFMSWTTVWRTLTREDALRTKIKTDPHSPGKVRAVQPLKNIDAFYKVFDIKEGDKMYMEPEKRVRIW
ncbi:MAG: M13 family metallopeptidase [Flavobacteriaceae bacterium]|nr:M13 family metallopeptidase [Flavobacteriaceae bacterium]